MGNALSHGTHLEVPREPDQDLLDAQQEADAHAAAELARLSKFPAATLRLCRTYNRHLTIVVAQSRFRARTHALRQLRGRESRDSRCVDPMATAREMFPQIAPDGLIVDAPPLPPSFTMYTNSSGYPPCIELTAAAHTRICACSLTTQLAVLLACSNVVFQRSECSAMCRHILNRVFNRSLIQVCSHAITPLFVLSLSLYQPCTSMQQQR